MAGRSAFGSCATRGGAAGAAGCMVGAAAGTGAGARPAAAQVAGRAGRAGVARTTARMQDAEGAHAASGGMEEADVLPGKGAEGAESVVRALALGALEERQRMRRACIRQVDARRDVIGRR